MRGVLLCGASMFHLTRDVRNAVISGNYYAALSLALALPDICGKLEKPGIYSIEKRYVTWFKANLQDLYTRPAANGITKHVFLTGEDCYALRCAFLHQGDMDITTQRARLVLERFHFFCPPPDGSRIDRNQQRNALVLQVDVFCEEVCVAVDAWTTRFLADPALRSRIEAIPQILDWRNQDGYWI
jgi:hypothetical protein